MSTACCAQAVDRRRQHNDDAPALDLLQRAVDGAEDREPAPVRAGALVEAFSRITASVRSSEAPAGSFAMPIRYCLSGAGTKLLGGRMNMKAVSASSRPWTMSGTVLRHSTPPTPRPSALALRLKTRLKPRKNPPKSLSMPAVFSSCGVSGPPGNARCWSSTVAKGRQMAARVAAQAAKQPSSTRSIAQRASALPPPKSEIEFAR